MNEDADYRSVAFAWLGGGLGILFWFTCVFILPTLIVLGIIFTLGLGDKQKNKPEAIYTYRDSITFMDKDTDERVIQLKNVEFRVLGKGSFMYQVQDGEKEVLVCDEIPLNTYPMIRKIEINE